MDLVFSFPLLESVLVIYNLRYVILNVVKLKDGSYIKCCAHAQSHFPCASHLNMYFVFFFFAELYRQSNLPTLVAAVLANIGPGA
jgi:hypothetical protein